MVPLSSRVEKEGYEEGEQVGVEVLLLLGSLALQRVGIVQPNQYMWVLVNAVQVALCCKCMSTGVLVWGGWGSALWGWVAWEGRAIHLLVDLELWGVVHGWVCGCDILFSTVS